VDGGCLACCPACREASSGFGGLCFGVEGHIGPRYAQSRRTARAERRAAAPATVSKQCACLRLARRNKQGLALAQVLLNCSCLLASNYLLDGLRKLRQTPTVPCLDELAARVLGPDLCLGFVACSRACFGIRICCFRCVIFCSLLNTSLLDLIVARVIHRSRNLRLEPRYFCPSSSLSSRCFCRLFLCQLLDPGLLCFVSAIYCQREHSDGSRLTACACKAITMLLTGHWLGGAAQLWFWPA
jgi:hypothetical protein